MSKTKTHGVKRRMSVSRSRLLWISVFGLAGTVVGAYFVYAGWQSVAPDGTAAHLTIALWLFIPVLGSLAFIAVSIVGLFAGDRGLFVTIGLSALAFLVGSMAMGRLGDEIRMRGFEDLAQRSETLVSAIEHYATEHGAPPGDLQQLVPEYLEAVPDTGMGAYPKYWYYSGEEAMQFESNPWALVVNTPSGGISFDLFIYLPRGNYPEEGYGGYLERVGAWAYVHE